MQHLHWSLPWVSLKHAHLLISRVMLLLVMLTPLTVAKQSPLRVLVDFLVLTLITEVRFEAQRAIGFPASHEAGATLSLKTLAGTQQAHGLARVLVVRHPH